MLPDIFRLVLSQIRSKRETGGDFRAQVAANTTGMRRLSAIMDRMGAETFGFYIDELNRLCRATYAGRGCQAAPRRFHRRRLR